MQFRLDDGSGLPVWDFTVLIGDCRYATRPMTMNDAEEMQQMQARPDYLRLRQWLANLFIDHKPDIGKCRPEMVMRMCVELLKYWENYAKLTVAEARRGIKSAGEK
jgi:hypothetical protein